MRKEVKSQHFHSVDFSRLGKNSECGYHTGKSSSSSQINPHPAETAKFIQIPKAPKHTSPKENTASIESNYNTLSIETIESKKDECKEYKDIRELK